MASQDDIAQALGISRASVNQVLSASPHCRVSEKLRKSIHETARAMGYQPRPTRLTSASTQVIAYVLCKSRHKYKIFPGEWHLSLLYSLQTIAQSRNHDIVFFAADDHPRAMHETVLRIARLRPRGVIFDGEIPRNLVYEFMKLNIPFLISGLLEYSNEPQWTQKLSSVSIDIEHSVELIIDKLIERNARRIGLILSPGVIYGNKVMLAAYRKIMQSRGIAINPSWVQLYEGYPDINLINRYKNLGITIDGLICTSDLVQGLGQFIRDNRLPIPSSRIAVYASYESLRRLGIGDMICFEEEMPRVAQITYDHLMYTIDHPHERKHVRIPSRLHEDT